MYVAEPRETFRPDRVLLSDCISGASGPQVIASLDGSFPFAGAQRSRRLP